MEAERLDGVRSAYTAALPHRITAVASSFHEGNAPATASAARLLARLSDDAGQEGVARICSAIAEDAERGVLNRASLTQLTALSAGAHPAVAALAGDPDVSRWNGQSLSSGRLAKVYGFTDLDGSQPDAWRYLVEVQDAGHPADVTGYR